MSLKEFVRSKQIDQFCLSCNESIQILDKVDSTICLCKQKSTNHSRTFLENISISKPPVNRLFEELESKVSLKDRETVTSREDIQILFKDLIGKVNMNKAFLSLPEEVQNVVVIDDVLSTPEAVYIDPIHLTKHDSKFNILKNQIQKIPVK